MRPSIGVLLLLLLSRALFGQVDAVALLRGKDLATVVQNTAPKPLAVVMQLYRNAAGKQPPLGDSIEATISPRAFTLQPGARQTVRLRVKAPIALGEVLRLTTTFLPVDGPSSGMQFVLGVRIISRVEVIR